MKILYLSCHAVLEYDELRILNDLGYDVTSIGGYINPKSPHVDTRPPLMIDSNKDREHKIHQLFEINKKNGVPLEKCSYTLNKEVVDDYDVIYVMHNLEWLDINWKVIKNKIVVLRTFLNLGDTELRIQKYVKEGLKVLRCSPMEREIENYAGEHGIIRFLKYECDFKPRNILHDQVITFGQSVKQRGSWCGSELIESLSKELPFKIFGPENHEYKFWGGRLSYEDQLIQLATNSCYFFTGTFPAQYTLSFVEALMTGIPIVSMGKNLSQSIVSKYPFEVPYILDEIEGFYGDNVTDIKSKLQVLLADRKLNEEMSVREISLGKKLFSAEQNMYLWKDFFNSL